MEMLFAGMTAFRRLYRTSGVMAVAVASMSMLSACNPTLQRSKAAGSPCATTFVTFVGFEESQAKIEQNGRQAWQGQIDRYNPSTDISAQVQLCLQTGRDIAVEADSRTFRTVLPAGAAPFYVLIDSRSEDPLVQKTPFLLD
ncbi:hypothetical protein [Brevundimonas sp.]|uniref:hypothetical protein n=1 Tax=Brevundimonas sp. TaxID=1871086 RepID=UPI002EDB83F5